MITSIFVQGQINPEHADLWRSLGDVTFTSSYERVVQVLEALAPGAVALLDPLYELESEEDDDDTGDAPPGFNLSDLALSDDRLQMLFTIECWYEDEFVELLRQLLLALPLRGWSLGAGMIRWQRIFGRARPWPRRLACRKLIRPRRARMARKVRRPRPSRGPS